MEAKILYGWLVINHFLNSNKYSELYEWFQEASKKYGVKLTVKTNAELLLHDVKQLKEEEQVDFILFWDKDIRLAQILENLELPLFNDSKSIEMCDDKGYTYLQLSKFNLPMPKTILAPKTYEQIGYKDFDFIESVEECLGYPMVVKECFGSFGWQVYLVHSKVELIELLKKSAPKPMLFQEYIATSSGRDIRIQVVGDKVVASMMRSSDSEDFRANLTLGGRMCCYEPTKKEQDLAIQCVKALGLEFGGVDLLFGPDGEPLVCEVNSNAHFRNIYDCTNINVAECIILHIKSKLIERRDG